jgi:DNA-binding response OmpR family regulator
MSRILLVEPHPDIRSLLEIVIVRLGHEPVAHDGADDGIPDVDAAVVDPDGPGLVIARRLRARRVPAVFTSIFPPDRDMLGLDPVAYLVKPFPLYALEHALTAAVDAAHDLCHH